LPGHGHSELHAPQLLGSLVVSVHTPLQMDASGAQQLPWRHACVGRHRRPHAPQLFGSLMSAASQGVGPASNDASIASASAASLGAS
jgi:hypothetical protein